MSAQVSSEVAPATYSQEFWFDSTEAGWSGANVPVVARLGDSVDLDRLASAVQAVTERHEALRTTLERVDGEVTQLVHATDDLELDVPGLRGLHGSLPTVEEAIARQFQVRGGRLVRVLLCRHDDGAALVLSAHHAVFDGWSARLVYREIAELYRASPARRAANLPPPDLQLRDFASWERHERLWEASDYWRDRLSGGHPRLRIGRGRAGDEAPATLKVWGLPPLLAGVAGRLREQAQTMRTSVPRVLMATVIASVSDHVDGEITVGVFTANRERVELLNVVGNLADLVPVRVDLTGDPTFRELVRRVDEASTNAFEQQRPMGLLRELIRQNPERRTGPLIDVAVNFLAHWDGEVGDVEALDDLSEIEPPWNALSQVADRWWDGVTMLEYAHRPDPDGAIGGYLVTNRNAVRDEEVKVLIERLHAVISRVCCDGDVRLSGLAR